MLKSDIDNMVKAYAYLGIDKMTITAWLTIFADYEGGNEITLHAMKKYPDKVIGYAGIDLIKSVRKKLCLVLMPPCGIPDNNWGGLSMQTYHWKKKRSSWPGICNKYWINVFKAINATDLTYPIEYLDDGQVYEL